ncbi:MAG: MMPL family transporter, partial [Candidatus Dormibacteraeota bacterium]|nr:MMPL family transporter [Candidatus Dormibacteraeota bacterium]
ESATANGLLKQAFPAQNASTLLLLYRSPTLTAHQPEFRAALLASVAHLRSDPRVQSVQTPYDPGPASAGLVSRSGREALAVVTLKNTPQAGKVTYADLKGEIGPSGPLEVTATGGLAITEAFQNQLAHDLGSAGRYSLPITAVLLLLVFGTVMAALLPLGVGAVAVLGGLGGVFVLARFTNVSQYATDLTALIGLGVGIDYSLFIVSRYREQLARGDSPEHSLEVALATSGRSVIFSGLTVAIGVSGLFFYRGSYLGTMGVGGTFAVISAVIFALTLLPALLAILGRRVNWLRLPLVGRERGRWDLWRLLANLVMRWPVAALVPALAVLAVLAFPVHTIQLGSGGLKLLPPHTPARQAYERVGQDFPGQDQETIRVVLDYGVGSPLATDRVAYTNRLAAKIDRMPGVIGVVDPLAPGVPPSVRQSAVAPHLAVLNVESRYQPSSDQAKSLVASIRAQATPPGGRKLVTGTTAAAVDEVAWIGSRTPAAAVFVVGVTYLVLFLLAGSLLLPLKAVLTNLVSLGAAFGAIVWIFQQGHLSRLLDFTPQTQDPSIAVLVFCMLFGLSMDYEVLMLSRIREEWLRTGDTRTAVGAGLQRSGRLITGAAAIMV